MARIYRQTYTKPIPINADIVIIEGKQFAKYKNRRGKTVCAKITEDGKNVICETSKWYIAFINQNDQWEYVPGYTDQSATLDYARKLEKNAERIKQGYEPYINKQLTCSLSEMIDKFKKHLLAKGTSQQQIDEKSNRIIRIIKECGFAKWDDISGTEVESFLLKLRNGINGKKGRSSRTVNSYLESLKHFCNWIQKENRAPYNPVAHLCCLNGSSDRRHIRRALSINECQKLLAVTKVLPEVFYMSGIERALLYHIALESGLRAKEIKTLTIGRCDLQSEPPTLTVKAAYSKNKKERIIPIRSELAFSLNKYIGTRPMNELLFIKMPSITNISKLLKKDLKAAGISYKDEDGCVVDFHALRHTYATNLARSGVYPKIAMDLLGHSDINLTMAYYSHTNIKERGAALCALPSLIKEG